MSALGQWSVGGRTAAKSHYLHLKRQSRGGYSGRTVGSQPPILFHQITLHIAPTFHSGPTPNLDPLQDLLLRARKIDLPRTTFPISSKHNSLCIRQNFCNCQNDQIITIMEDKFTSGLILLRNTSQLAP